MKYLFRYVVEHSRRAARANDIWKRDAHDDQGIRRRDAEAGQSSVRGSDGDLTTANGRRRDFPTNITKRNTARRGANNWRRSIAAMRRAPADVLYQEKTFELPLEHDVVVTGRMDQVNRAGDRRNRDRGLQDREAARREESREGFAAERLRAGGARSARARAGAAGVLQPDDQRAGGHARATTKRSQQPGRESRRLADQIRAAEFSAKPGFSCVQLLRLSNRCAPPTSS